MATSAGERSKDMWEKTALQTPRSVQKEEEGALNVGAEIPLQLMVQRMVREELHCSGQQIYYYFSFSLSKTLLNPINSHHMVNVIGQVFSMNKNEHLLSLVRMWEYSRMRTSVRIAETAPHSSRHHSGLWNTKGNNLLYLTCGISSRNEAPAVPPSSFNTQSWATFPFPVTNWNAGRQLIFLPKQTHSTNS